MITSFSGRPLLQSLELGLQAFAVGVQLVCSLFQSKDTLFDLINLVQVRLELLVLDVELRHALGYVGRHLLHVGVLCGRQPGKQAGKQSLLKLN